MADEASVLSQYVPGFRANLNLAPQQTESKLIGAVEADLNYSEAGTQFNADDLATSDPEDVQTRVGDTPDKFLGYTRRVGLFKAYQDSAWLDNVDKAAMLEDPTNETMASLMAGRWRKVDATIIADGMLGNAFTKADENAVPQAVGLPASQTIAVNLQSVVHQNETIPAASADYGLSIGKLIRAQTLLDDSEIEGQRFVAVGPQQMEDLLQRTPTTSDYYSGVHALVSGKVPDLLGFTFIKLPRKRIPITGVNRRCVAWVKPAVVYKARTITQASIRVRYDKQDTPQAYYKAQHGVTRRYDAGVVEILCKEG